MRKDSLADDAASESLAFESNEGALVVAQVGASWPDWLAAQLGGKASSLLIVQQDGESLDELIARAQERARQIPDPITSLTWVTTSAQISRLPDLTTAFGSALAPSCCVRVVKEQHDLPSADESTRSLIRVRATQDSEPELSLESA